MSQFPGAFGRQTKTSGKLHEMLNDPTITPQKLFSIPHITGDMTQNIQDFLNFCKKRKDFTTRMLRICFNTSYEQLLNDDIKNVARHTIQVLTNDDVSLSNFLFQQPQPKDFLEIEEKVQQQNTLNIESEAQRLFGQSTPKKQVAAWEKQEVAFNKYEIVMLTLEQLHVQQKNQTCLGFVNKLYSSVLRRQGNQFLQFLKQKPQYLDLLLANLNYCAIANIVALALACEDKNGEYKHQQLKRQIFKRILDYGFNNIQNDENFRGFMEAIQQILSSTKQSYFEFFQDFKRCANILVSEQTLKKFFQLLDKSEKAFQNASWYLQHIVKRINSQTEEHDYYRPANSAPSMKFQHTFFFTNLPVLVQQFGKSKCYASRPRVNYLSFLMSLLKNMIKNNFQIPAFELFKCLIKHYQAQKSQGIVKTSLFQLLKTAAKNLNGNQSKQLVEWILQARIQQEVLQKLFDNPTTEKINSNASSCFTLGLLFQIQNKQNTFLENYSKKNNLNLTQIFQKYYTKIAQEQDCTSPMYTEIDPSFKLKVRSKYENFFNFSTKDNQKQEENKQQTNDNQRQTQTQVVGKNSVVIPVLNLPCKMENNIKITIQQEQVEQVKVPSAAQLSRQALIRDLKNTKFDIPKMKPKKVETDQKKQQQKPQQIQKQPFIPSKEEPAKATEPLETKPKQKPQTNVKSVVDGTVNPQQKKYFVRHLVLF